MSKHTADPMIGRSLGPYKIVGKLGHGGMGTVYLAHDASLDRRVALKTLALDHAKNKDWLARFHREARAAARLNHPRIVRVYAVDMKSKPPYIAMECIDGVPLDTLLKAQGKLPWRQALTFCGQVASALECAHKHGIVHRDIKPGNILVDVHAQVHVADFGVAKLLETQTNLTAAGKLIGTPQYMSPEQFGEGEVGTASDLFSLGAMTYEMLTGELPFKADTPAKLIKKITMETPNAALEEAEDVPKVVRQFVLSLLEKDPANRYASATDVLLDLQDLHKEQAPTHAPPRKPTVDVTKRLVEELLDVPSTSTLTPRRNRRGQTVMRFLTGLLLLIMAVLAAYGLKSFWDARARPPLPGSGQDIAVEEPEPEVRPEQRPGFGPGPRGGRGPVRRPGTRNQL